MGSNSRLLKTIQEKGSIIEWVWKRPPQRFNHRSQRGPRIRFYRIPLRPNLLCRRTTESTTRSHFFEICNTKLRSHCLFHSGFPVKPTGEPNSVQRQTQKRDRRCGPEREVERTEPHTTILSALLFGLPPPPLRAIASGCLATTTSHCPQAAAHVAPGTQERSTRRRTQPRPTANPTEPTDCPTAVGVDAIKCLRTRWMGRRFLACLDASC